MAKKMMKEKIDMKKFEDIVNDYNPPKITDEMLRLSKELDKLNGFSKDKKFLPLIGSHLAWGYDLNGTICVTSKNNINSVFTILFVTPTLNEKVNDEIEGYNTLDELKKFFAKWLLNKDYDKVSNDELRATFFKHTCLFSVKSVPIGLKDEFINDIEKTNIIIRQINPEHMTKTCPVCKTTIMIDGDELISSCTQCGMNFA